MSARQILGIVLIVAGILGIVYKGFDYTKRNRQAKIGSIELNIKDKEHVDVPVWVGLVAIAAGAGLLLKGRK
jgi:divalent metal cation (Fe/Co/Zn/Cd) transporter